MARYRLTESDLKNTIKESVQQMLSELDWRTYASAAKKGDEWRREHPRHRANQWNRVMDFERAARDAFDRQHGLEDQYDDRTSDGYSASGTINFDPTHLDVTGSRDYDFGDENPHKLNHNVYHMGKKYGKDGGYGRARMWDYAHETTPEEFYDSEEMGQRFRDAEKEVEDFKNGKTKYFKGKGWQNESRLRKAIYEAVKGVLNEHRGPEGGYADYEGEDISYQSVYEQALDYLEGGHDVSSARELISALGFRPETFNDVDYETAYGACEDAIAFHYGEDENTVFENKIRKMVKKIISESIRDEYFPDEDQSMDDYYFGVMMTLKPDGILSEDWSEETINRLQSVKEEYCESENGFCSVIITKVNLVPDEFGGYDISIEAAVSAPEIPTHVVEKDVIEQLWYWFEDITGERTTNFHIVDERIVFDNRREEYK